MKVTVIPFISLIWPPCSSNIGNSIVADDVMEVAILKKPALELGRLVLN